MRFRRKSTYQRRQEQSSSLQQHQLHQQYHHEREGKIRTIPVWKTAVDVRTGRMYYFDAISRKSQWEK
eukprot:12404630-Ditylum_brightwellii.AAC.1